MPDTSHGVTIGAGAWSSFVAGTSGGVLRSAMREMEIAGRKGRGECKGGITTSAMGR